MYLKKKVGIKNFGITLRHASIDFPRQFPRHKVLLREAFQNRTSQEQETMNKQRKQKQATSNPKM